MAQQQTFRSAFNGFNREDVVRYIEYLNTQHAAELNQLRSELEFFRSKPAQEVPAAVSPAETPASTEMEELVEQQAARIRELFDQCKSQEQQISELNTQLRNAQEKIESALSEKSRLAADLDHSIQQQVNYKSNMEQELEAYRRAEQTERMARERAEQMYRQANAVLADATIKVDDAATQIAGQGAVEGSLFRVHQHVPFLAAAVGTAACDAPERIKISGFDNLHKTSEKEARIR